MTIYIVLAEHPTAEGQRMSAHTTQAGADAQVIRHINALLVNDPYVDPRPVNVDNWSEIIEELQCAHGAAHCYVEVTRLETQD